VPADADRSSGEAKVTATSSAAEAICPADATRTDPARHFYGSQGRFAFSAHLRGWLRLSGRRGFSPARCVADALGGFIRRCRARCIPPANPRALYARVSQATSQTLLMVLSLMPLASATAINFRWRRCSARRLIVFLR
jgi:hypothetical protein